jgi:hypothetical protein
MNSQFNTCLTTMQFALVRSEKFCSGNIKSVDDKLQNIILTSFGNRNYLEKYGLTNAYKILLKSLLEIAFDAPIIIGSILNAINTEPIEITKYTTQTGKIITLTNLSILTELLNQIDKTKVIIYCQASPLYNIYYKYCESI